MQCITQRAQCMHSVCAVHVQSVHVHVHICSACANAPRLLHYREEVVVVRAELLPRLLLPTDGAHRALLEHLGHAREPRVGALHVGGDVEQLFVSLPRHVQGCRGVRVQGCRAWPARVQGVGNVHYCVRCACRSTCHISCAKEV